MPAAEATRAPAGIAVETSLAPAATGVEPFLAPAATTAEAALAHASHSCLSVSLILLHYRPIVSFFVASCTGNERSSLYWET